MTDIPFGERRRVRYQDEAGNTRTVRARLIKPNPAKQPDVVVVLEISASDDDHAGAYLVLKQGQLLEIYADRPLPLPPMPNHAPWFG
ncbi:hypothetical protein IPM44_04035 [bacterium]|nr:MAG: hypothetical protein IPM44_04035 [bacterium]